MSRLLTTEFNSPLVDPKTGKITPEWARKLAHAGVLDMQGLVRGILSLTDLLFGMTAVKGGLCDVGGVGDIQFRVNCDSAGNILDTTKVAWAIRMGPTFDSFAIFRSPAGATTSFAVFLTIKSSGHINFPSLPSFANNAAAITGGLVAGDLYRTGLDPDTVCVVH